MDNKRECFHATLDSLSLQSSNFELLGELEGTVNINFSAQLDLKIKNEVTKLNENEVFVVSLKGVVNGSQTTDADKDIFKGDCVLVGKFKVKSKKGIGADKIKHSLGFYGLQIYPLLREHIKENLSKMNINSNDMPWDIGIGAARVE